MRIRPINVGRIYLDPENPRHDPIGNEKDIISHLLEHEDVRAIARSIAKLGSTSPIELLALVPHPTAARSYLTAEGNRRVCALKLLGDPDKAPTEKDKRYFRQLRESMKEPVEKVLAVIFDSIEDTRPWVKLRHDGALGGEGLKAWQPAQSTRFAMKGSDRTPNAQALLLLDYAKRKGLLSEKAVEAINLTTLTRYLSTPAVRFALGLSDAKTIAINVPVDEFDRALKQFLQDSLGKTPVVHSRSKADERTKYGERLHASGVSPVTRGLPPYTPDPASAPPSSSPASSAGAATNKSTARRNKQDRDQAKYVVPTGFAAPIDDPIFQRLFLELRTVPVHQYSFAATYLLRAVIEQAATLFLRKHGIAPPKELHLKLAKVEAKLQSQSYNGPGLPALRKMSSDVDSRYSPDTIGLFIHGGAVPTATNAIRAWDTFQPIMIEIVRQLT